MDAMQARDCYYVLRAMHDGACPKCGHTGASESFHTRYDDCLVCPECRFQLSEDEIKGIQKITPEVLTRRVTSLEACRSELVERSKIKESK